MPKVPVLNIEGEQVEELELNSNIFDVEINEDTVLRTVKYHMANKHLGTSSTKIRSEVRGGGKKPWRQKGTGRARHGSSRSPLWIGGGITFGPRSGKGTYRLPRKMKRNALKSVLTSKLKDGEIIVLDQINLSETKTKEMVRVLSNVKAGKKPLVVIPVADDNVIKSARNIPGVKTIQARQLNVLDLLNHANLVMTKEAVSQVEEVFA